MNLLPTLHKLLKIKTVSDTCKACVYMRSFKTDVDVAKDFLYYYLPNQDFLPFFSQAFK